MLSFLTWCLFEIMSYKFYLKTSNKWLNLDLHKCLDRTVLLIKYKI